MNKAPAFHDLDWYMDRAREHSGIPSDGKLSLALGMQRTTSNVWRTKRAWPDENHMITLCELAGVDPQEGLLDLARWRAKGRAAEVWASIKNALPVIIFVAVLALGNAHSAYASDVSQTSWGKEVSVQNYTLCDNCGSGGVGSCGGCGCLGRPHIAFRLPNVTFTIWPQPLASCSASLISFRQPILWPVSFPTPSPRT